MVNPSNGCKYKVKFVVVEEDCTPLLGSKAIQQMNLVKVQFQNIKSVKEETVRPMKVVKEKQPLTE